MARYTRVASTWFCELNVPALCVAAALGATMASSSQAAPSVPTSNCATLEDHGGGVRLSNWLATKALSRAERNCTSRAEGNCTTERLGMSIKVS